LENEKEKKLTRKQRLFCQYYIESLNGTQAYVKAYKNDNIDTSKVNACKLLKQPSIRLYIDEILEQNKSELVASGNEVMIYLTEVMRGNVKDQFDLDPPLKERNKAAELLGKKYALFIDRKEIDLPPAIESKLDKLISNIDKHK